MPAKRAPPSSLAAAARPHARTYACATVVMLAYQIAMNRIDWLSRTVVNDLFMPGRIAGVLVAIGWMAGLGVVAAVGYAVARTLFSRVSVDVEGELRRAALDRLHRLGGSFYRAHAVGDLTSRVVVDAAQLQQVFSLAAFSVLNALFGIVTSLQVLLAISPRMTLAVAGVVPLLVLTMRFLSSRMITSAVALRRAVASLEALAQRHFAGIRVIRSLAIEDAAIARFDRATAEAQKTSITVTRVRALIPPTTNIVAALGIFIVFVYGAALLRRDPSAGGLTPGDFFAFVAAWTRLTVPFVNLGLTLALLQQGRASFARLKVIFDAPLDREDWLAPPPVATGPAGLSVRDLPVAVPGGPTLARVSFELPAGASLAIMGPTGAGKSTLAQLLVRLQPTPAGHVFLDGRDVCQLDGDTLRARVGYAPQDGFLFSSSVADNVGMGATTGGDRASTERALRDAQVLREVDALPERASTIVGERGVQLSGGQRQRIALARALLSDSPLLVLDDPLSAVDAQSEAAILDALNGRMTGRSIVLVTNRVAAAARCDRILVLDKTGSVQLGTHAELLGGSGLYRLLATQQSIDHELEALAATPPTDAPATSTARETSEVGAVPPGGLEIPPGTVPTLLRLMQELREHRAPVAAILGLIVLTAAAGVLRPWAMGRVTEAADRTTSLLVPALVLSGALVLTQLLVLAQTWLAQTTGSRVAATIRKQLFRFASGFGMRYFDTAAVGRLASRIVNDPEVIGEMFSMGVFLAVGDVLAIAVSVVVMLGLDWRMALASFWPVPVALVALKVVRMDMHSRMLECDAARGTMSAVVTEQMTGIGVIQAYGREALMAQRFEVAVTTYARSLHAVGQYESSTMGIVLFAQTISLASVLAWAAQVRLHHGAMTLSAVVVFTQYVRQFFEPANMLLVRLSVSQLGTVAARQVFQLLDTTDRDAPATAASPPVEVPSDEAFGLEHVEFGYRANRPVTSDVVLSVRRGERLALVGPTGSGKSTITQLLLRLYDADSGVVRVFGRDVRTWDPHELRRSFAVVPQEVMLFAGTILDNIALGDPTPDRERAIRALDRIGVRELFLARHGGLDARVDERGLNFSAGERQLLSFARALYREAPIVVLDEATASIDSDTEVRLQHAFDALVSGRTALIVAHRLSTIESADRIAVFQAGRVVELGSHAELIARDGLYARLHRLQMRKAAIAPFVPVAPRTERGLT